MTIFKEALDAMWHNSNFWGIQQKLNPTQLNIFKSPMDPAVASKRKYDWGMLTKGCFVPSQTVAMDP